MTVVTEIGLLIITILGGLLAIKANYDKMLSDESALKSYILRLENCIERNIDITERIEARLEHLNGNVKQNSIGIASEFRELSQNIDAVKTELVRMQSACNYGQK